MGMMSRKVSFFVVSFSKREVQKHGIIFFHALATSYVQMAAIIVGILT